MTAAALALKSMFFTSLVIDLICINYPGQKHTFRIVFGFYYYYYYLYFIFYLLFFIITSTSDYMNSTYIPLLMNRGWIER